MRFIITKMMIIDVLFQDSAENSVGIGSYKLADIPRAMMREKYVFVCELEVLPNLMDHFQHFQVKDLYDSSLLLNKWYNNQPAVGNIRYFRKISRRYNFTIVQQKLEVYREFL